MNKRSIGFGGGRIRVRRLAWIFFFLERLGRPSLRTRPPRNRVRTVAGSFVAKGGQETRSGVRSKRFRNRDNQPMPSVGAGPGREAESSLMKIRRRAGGRPAITGPTCFCSPARTPPLSPRSTRRVSVYQSAAGCRHSSRPQSRPWSSALHRSWWLQNALDPVTLASHAEKTQFHSPPGRWPLFPARPRCRAQGPAHLLARSVRAPICLPHPTGANVKGRPISPRQADYGVPSCATIIKTKVAPIYVSGPHGAASACVCPMCVRRSLRELRRSKPHPMFRLARAPAGTVTID